MGDDGRVLVRPISPPALATLIVRRILASEPDRWLRIAVDGAPAADPGRWADALVDGVHVGGRRVLHIRASDFLRPASLRFERGRTNPDAYYEDWLDVGGLRRTVLDPLGSGGDRRIVTSLWNATTDRASRAPFLDLPQGGVCLLSGSLLLGGELPLDLAIHMWLSPAALARRTDPNWRWTLPAFARYDREVDPAGFADIVARVDHPDRPGLVER